MLQSWVVVLGSFGYIALLFAIAFYADRRARGGRSIIASPIIYSLSLAVYATAWTFYGSVGRAANDGVGFLPIYIGPTLMILLWWFVLRKMIRVAKLARITSLADFVASRYGKSALLGGLVTLIAVIGILPYISLQLKAVASSFEILLQYPQIVMPAKTGATPFLQVNAFYVAVFMALFTIAFGTRHLDVGERHEGMVAAISFESIGGISAATGMVIVETIALSTMVCNDLIMPVLLRSRRLNLAARSDLTSLLLDIRRGAIIVILMLGYFYYYVAGEAYALVSIGLISFAAVAQFAPAFLGGMYWKGATRNGALVGLAAGFIVWLYTLLLPAFAKSGWFGMEVLERGLFGVDLLRPTQLFGLTGLDQITHAMIWSMIANIGCYVLVSLTGRQSAVEHSQATLFVDVFTQTGERGQQWRTATSVSALQTLLGRFLGPARATDLFVGYATFKGLK